LDSDPHDASAPPKSMENRTDLEGAGQGPSSKAAQPRASLNDFERGFQGPLYGPKGAAFFGAVCALPFISKLSGAAPFATLAPPVVAFLIGSGWMLGIMALIHWLGEQPALSLRLKRRILLAAFVVPAVAALVLLRIVGAG
jgi:hypothetical protein